MKDEHAVIEFLKDANGYDNGGMQQHGHFDTRELAAAKAEQLRKATSRSRFVIVPLMRFHALD